MFPAVHTKNHYPTCLESSVRWASTVMGIWSATAESRKFLEVWLHIYYSIISHWSPNYRQAPFVLDKHRKSKNSLCFRSVTKQLQLPVTSLQNFCRGVELPQNHSTQLTLVWGLCGGSSMSSSDGACFNPFYHTYLGITKSQRFCTKNFNSLFPSHEQTFRPLKWLQIHLPSFDFLISAVSCTSHMLCQYFLGTCKALVLHHETQEFWCFRGNSLWQSVSLCTPDTDAPNLSCIRPALETAQQIQRFLRGIESLMTFTEGKGTEEAA